MLFFRYVIFYFPFFVFLFGLAGCSSNFKSVVDSAQAVIDLNKNTNITSQYIASIPYANSLVTINNDKPILLILAFADVVPPSVDTIPTKGIHKLTWLSNDSGSIVTENGRIIHTTGFTANNLEELASSASALPKLTNTTAWQARYDWSPGYRYGFTANVEQRSLGIETISTNLWRQDAEHISETVTFDHLETEFTNHYWLVPATDSTKVYVIKSIQYLGPNMDKIEMLMMKPFIEPTSNTTLSNTTNSKDSE